MVSPRTHMRPRERERPRDGRQQIVPRHWPSRLTSPLTRRGGGSRPGTDIPPSERSDALSACSKPSTLNLTCHSCELAGRTPEFSRMQFLDVPRYTEPTWDTTAAAFTYMTGFLSSRRNFREATRFTILSLPLHNTYTPHSTTNYTTHAHIHTHTDSTTIPTTK